MSYRHFAAQCRHTCLVAVSRCLHVRPCSSVHLPTGRQLSLGRLFNQAVGGVSINADGVLTMRRRTIWAP